MREFRLLTCLSQLGLSVAVPPVVLIALAAWLRNRFGWGKWVIWVAVVFRIYCAVTGFMSSVRTLSLFTGGKQGDSTVSFNEHE